MFKKVIAGIVTVTVLLCGEIILLSMERSRNAISEQVSSSVQQSSSFSVTFLAFGDINLGRSVGQHIIKEDAQYPFRRYSIYDDSADIVFANLESPVSDQNGETGHPKFNLIFTAPPEAATTLQYSGIDIVSTANNHALDYGISALLETIDRLHAVNIATIGTSKVEENLFKPLIVEKNNIKFAIFGVTSFVNMTFKNWRRYVATPDTNRLRDELLRIKDSVDVIIISYHGGIEYIDHPAQTVKDFAEWSIANGVDIFLGHHPHVPYGVYKKGGKFIVHSLGNFIFFQPHHYWTQRSYGIKFNIMKINNKTSIDILKFIPVQVISQTQPLSDSMEIHKLFFRTQQLSNIDLSPYWN